MAGRELDALIAEKVMGWTDLEVGLHSGILKQLGKKPDRTFDSTMSVVPRYSEDIGAAWQVVEKLARPMDTSDRAQRVCDVFHGALGMSDILYDHASKAAREICLAALKAVGA